MSVTNTEAPLESPVQPDLGRWRIKRNLHYWVIGVIVSVLVVFLMADVMKSESPDEAILVEQQKQKERQNAALNKIDQVPTQESLEQTLARQEQEAKNKLAAEAALASARLPESLSFGQGGPLNLPPLPAGLPTPGAMQENAPSQEALIAAEKREEQILSSPIMAVDNSFRVAANGSGNARSATPNSLERMNEEMAVERERARTESRAEHDQMFNRAISAAGMMGGGAPPGGGDERAHNPESFYDSFGLQGVDVLRPIASRGQYALMQGAVIPVVLITQIRSDLPGDIKAQTTMDVYDSVDGSNLLIPKGSVLVGKYNSEVAFGQQKVMAGFSRLIFPSGASVDLGGMKGAEASGESGLADHVDNHFFRMFANNFLIAGVAQIFQKDQGNVTVINNGGTSGQLSNTAGEIMADTVRVINERNRAIPPTIYVLRGHRFAVLVNKDMVLPPYVTGVKQ